MIERPILFTGEMVRRVLDGTKTQTRRVVRNVSPNTAVMLPDTCPYGKPGDRLWVRETWRPALINASQPSTAFWTVQFRAGFGVLRWPRVSSAAHQEAIVSKVRDGELTRSETGNDYGKWRPSIFMPRWASRITLEVTDVRVQRVQDISEGDAMAEGVTVGRPVPARVNGKLGEAVFFDPVIALASLWDSINGKRPGCSWRDNPWVWAVTFRRLGDEA